MDDPDVWVVPNQSETEVTIRGALQELVQLNQDHPYSYDREELVRMLDEALGLVPSTTSAGGSEGAVVAIHEAALRGDVEAMRQHIEAGADLDAGDPSGGSTPLIIAATFEQPEVARVLIDAGADVDVQNNDGTTALLSAALFAHTEIVRALLEAGADVTVRNSAPPRWTSPPPPSRRCGAPTTTSLPCSIRTG
jgi:hypothetical protein